MYQNPKYDNLTGGYTAHFRIVSSDKSERVESISFVVTYHELMQYDTMDEAEIAMREGLRRMGEADTPTFYKNDTIQFAGYKRIPNSKIDTADNESRKLYEPDTKEDHSSTEQPAPIEMAAEYDIYFRITSPDNIVRNQHVCFMVEYERVIQYIEANREAELAIREGLRELAEVYPVYTDDTIRLLYYKRKRITTVEEICMGPPYNSLYV